jgi:hypothetical protein
MAVTCPFVFSNGPAVGAGTASWIGVGIGGNIPVDGVNRTSKPLSRGWESNRCKTWRKSRSITFAVTQSLHGRERRRKPARSLKQSPRAPADEKGAEADSIGIAACG